MDGDIMFLPGQREKYFDPTQSEKNHENDPPHPQNKNHHDTKNKRADNGTWRKQKQEWR